MTSLHINNLPDELLVAIFWPSKRLFSRQSHDDAVWASVWPTPRIIRENADESSYQQSEPLFPNPNFPPAFADAAYNLLVASVCRRWRRLAERHVTTLLVKERRDVSCKDLSAALNRFPNLTHLHLNDSSLETIDDAFLARVAASCPNLTAFHLGGGIEQNVDEEEEEEGQRLLTRAGLDVFFRRCTRLEHLSLGCLSSCLVLPPPFYQLAHLRSLAIADRSALSAPGLKNLSSLTALSLNAAIWFQDLHILASFPSLTHLSLSERISQFQPRPLPSRPFSFAHLPSLKSLNLGDSCPPFDVMFPSESPCSLLERLTLDRCHELAALPHDLEDRLPCLRELTISGCRSFLEQPEQLTSLTSLRSLKLSDCSLVGLPHDFGELSVLKTLVLHKLNVDLPASCSRLKSLETLLVTVCPHLRELPEGFGALTALKSLGLAGSPSVILPDDIGELTNLQTLFLKSYQQHHLRPSSFTHLASLTRLELQDCALTELPEAMGELRSLRELYIQACSHLQKLPDSVSALLGLEILEVDNCSSLFSVPRSFVNLTRLKELELTGCGLLRKAPEFLPGSLEALSVASLHHVTRLPGAYSLPCLKKLSLYMVIFPAALSSSLSSLEQLKLYLAWEEEFPVHHGSITSLPSNFSRLSRLQILDLEDCKQLEALPEDLGELKLLVILNAHGCDKLHDDEGPTYFACLRGAIRTVGGSSDCL
ncbi:unnamed protein product [Closterium sp. NIES-65]|nr:unnamed protein product [Closterium sp. NIES-65]